MLLEIVQTLELVKPKLYYGDMFILSKYECGLGSAFVLNLT